MAVAATLGTSTDVPDEEQRASPKPRPVGLHTMFAGMDDSSYAFKSLGKVAQADQADT